MSAYIIFMSLAVFAATALFLILIFIASKVLGYIDKKDSNKAKLTSFITASVLSITLGAAVLVMGLDAERGKMLNNQNTAQNQAVTGEAVSGAAIDSEMQP